MEKWFISIVDDSGKRAKLSVLVGILSTVGGLATFLTILAYPVSAFLGVVGLLMAYTSLDSENGWHAVAGMMLNGLGLLGPLIFLAVVLLFPVG